MSWIFRLLRKALRTPAPSVTQDAALRIAAEEAIRRGDIPPRDPIAREGVKAWSVWLDSAFRPSRIVEIDNQTGEVRRYIAPPR